MGDTQVMSLETDRRVIAEGGHASLIEIQETLADAGIASVLERPPKEKCSS